MQLSIPIAENRIRYEFSKINWVSKYSGLSFDPSDFIQGVPNFPLCVIHFSQKYCAALQWVISLTLSYSLRNT